MAHLSDAALRLFETQHGVASPLQLTERGVNVHSIKRLQRTGALELVLQGAYRLRGVQLDELGRCVAVCQAHPSHMIAGPTAGRIWGFRRLPNDRRVHTLSPPHSQPTRAGWVVPYRTAAFHSQDVVERGDGITVTSRARTAFDLARFVDSLDLLSIIEQAMADGELGEEEMRAVAFDWLSPRRRWVRRYLDQLDRRTTGAPAESHPEVELGQALNAAGVRGLVRQFAIELPGYGPVRFDLAVADLRWEIEVDVFPTHRETAGRAADLRRDDAADRSDWLVTRVPSDGFGANLPHIVRELVGVYHSRRTALGER
jgi:hypothetical protein